MLVGLDEVDWKSIHHSHGTAENFPRWLEELGSQNKRTFSQAYSYITEYSNHQGSHYPVTPYVIPFLIQLLQKDEVRIKATILDLLAILGSNEKRDLRFVYPRHPDDQVSNFSKEWHDDWKVTYRESMEVSWEKSQVAAAEGLEIYLDLLETSPYLKVRIAAAQLLSGFPQLAEKFVPRLISLIIKEENTTLKANMILVLADMPVPDTNYFDLLENLLSRKEAIKIRVVAAYTQAQLLKEHTSRRALKILLSIARHPEKDLSKYKHLYLSITQVARVLCNLNENKFGISAEALWEGLNKANPYDAFRILGPLFYLTFKNPVPSENFNQSELTTFQLLILDFVASVPELWQKLFSGNANACSALSLQPPGQERRIKKTSKTILNPHLLNPGNHA